MTNQSELALDILAKTEQDIILWEYDHQSGYIGYAQDMKFRVVCDGKDWQIAIDDFYFSASGDLVKRICQAIARQSERRRAAFYLDRLRQIDIRSQETGVRK